MEIKQKASAGTLESSDAIIELTPAKGITVELESVVAAQFGEEIENTVRDVLSAMGVTDAHVRVTDRGALDCVIRARVETAVRRSAGEV